MSHKNTINYVYFIAKQGMFDWFLYTVEQCSFGKRIVWTKDIKKALVFSSEKRAEIFKTKVLENVQVCIHKIP